MKGRQACRIAAGMAAEIEASLLRAGCVPPPREDITAAMWPFARVLALSAKALRRAERQHRLSLEHAAAAESACLDAMEAVAGAWAAAHPPAPVPGSRIADFDPAQWRVVLQPAADAETAPAAREAA